MTFAFGHLATVSIPERTFMRLIKISNRSQMTCARPSRLPFEPQRPHGQNRPCGNLDDLRSAILPPYVVQYYLTRQRFGPSQPERVFQEAR